MRPSIPHHNYCAAMLPCHICFSYFCQFAIHVHVFVSIFSSFFRCCWAAVFVHIVFPLSTLLIFNFSVRYSHVLASIHGTNVGAGALSDTFMCSCVCVSSFSRWPACAAEREINFEAEFSFANVSLHLIQLYNQVVLKFTKTIPYSFRSTSSFSAFGSFHGFYVFGRGMDNESGSHHQTTQSHELYAMNTEFTSSWNTRFFF